MSTLKFSTNKLLMFCAILMLAAAGYWYGVRDNSTTTTTIETTQVDRGNITRAVATSGSVRALVKVEVGSQLSGQIKEIYVDFNSPVTAGELIAVIDPQTYETRVLQNRADLKVAEANVEVQHANISRAEANLRRARLDYERQKPLVEKGTIAETSLDSVLAGYESAKADLEMAKAQLRNAQATSEQRQAGLETALIDLERTKIRSPIDGVVIERTVDVGQTVAASLSSPILFNIAQDLKQIQIEANVDEADIGNVKQGNRVTFAVDAFPDMEFSGEVEQVRLSPTELQNVVTYTVIINARNPDLKLLPGMTAIVEIVTGESRDVLRVSNDALRFRPPKEFQTETASSDQDSPFAGGGAPGRNAFPGGRQGNPMSRNLDQITANLGIDDKQKQQISDGLEAFFTDMRSNAGTGGMFGSVDSTDPAVMQERMQATRQRMTGEVEKVFRQYLTEDQFRQYQQYMRIQSEARRGQVWITPDGIKIEPRQIRMGISDDSFTEILSGVEEGDEVVTRIREVSL